MTPPVESINFNFHEDELFSSFVFHAVRASCLSCCFESPAEIAAGASRMDAKVFATSRMLAELIAVGVGRDDTATSTSLNGTRR